MSSAHFILFFLPRLWRQHFGKSRWNCAEVVSMNMMTQLTQVMVMFGAVWVQVSTRIWHSKVQLLTLSPFTTGWTVGNLSVWFWSILATAVAIGWLNHIRNWCGLTGVQPHINVFPRMVQSSAQSGPDKGTGTIMSERGLYFCVLDKCRQHGARRGDSAGLRITDQPPAISKGLGTACPAASSLGHPIP